MKTTSSIIILFVFFPTIFSLWDQLVLVYDMNGSFYEGLDEEKTNTGQCAVQMKFIDSTQDNAFTHIETAHLEMNKDVGSVKVGGFELNGMNRDQFMKTSITGFFVKQKPLTIPSSDQFREFVVNLAFECERHKSTSGKIVENFDLFRFIDEYSLEVSAKNTLVDMKMQDIVNIHLEMNEAAQEILASEVNETQVNSTQDEIVMI